MASTRIQSWKDICLFIFIFLLLNIVNPTIGLASEIPEKAYIKNVPAHTQSFLLSCEARSAVDWAAFWGVKIREKKFLNQLPRSDNPNLGFVGYPNDPWGNIPPKSYGVYANPIAKLLSVYGLNAEARIGMQWNEAQIEIVNGRPVIVWVIGQMWQGVPRKYITSDGKKVTVAYFEHTMILIGYDRSRIYAVDSYSGKIKTYSKKAFLQSWATLGNMAVTGQVKPREKNIEISKLNQTTVYLPMVNFIISK
jgi:uncharacterized protein YvpB